MPFDFSAIFFMLELKNLILKNKVLIEYPPGSGRAPIKKILMTNFIIPILLLIDGAACILAAVFAQNIGLDPNAAWGPSRFILLDIGIILISISLLAVFFTQRGNHFRKFIVQSETSITLFLLGHIWAVIFTVYAGFITFGNFTTWNHTTHYYTQLADAFSHGYLYVDLQLGKSLSGAVDLNDPANRPPFDDEIWDMSLYKGKFYLYWGPVPSLLIMPIQLIVDKKVTDNYLVFFFLSGLLIFNSLIILRLWKKFFPQIPAQYVYGCIPLIGLILPIPWSTGIPNVYEAAIGAGQFFLIGGIYFSLSVFEQFPAFDKKSLFLAGLFWACSVGSRAINVFSVIFLVLVVLVWILKVLPKPINWILYYRSIYSLLLPLIVGAIMIGWYNWARFDSPLEFGLRYQITIYDLNKQSNLVFEPGYFFTNLYAYIFHPYVVIAGFPFIQPTAASAALQKFNVIAPQFYYAGRVTGLLFSAPFLLLGLVHLFSENKVVAQEASSPLSRSYRFVLFLFGGSFLLNFSILLFYFYGQERFLVDFISQITLLAIVGYWQLIAAKIRSNTLSQKLLLTAANLLIIFTICAGILLAFSSETSRFAELNPHFFETINQFIGIQ